MPWIAVGVLVVFVIVVPVLRSRSKQDAIRAVSREFLVYLKWLCAGLTVVLLVVLGVHAAEAPWWGWLLVSVFGLFLLLVGVLYVLIGLKK